MKLISFDDGTLGNWVSEHEIAQYEGSLSAAEKMLQTGSGPGSDFLGWLNLPREIKSEDISAIKETAEELRSKSDIFITVGIGGSYLGARSAIEFLAPAFDDMRKPRTLFAGHHVNSDFLSDLLQLIEDKDVTVNVISKSGTTTEPGITFRVLRQWMEKKYGREGAAQRIVATTDPEKGALRKLAGDEGYKTFSIPPDIGGRFSVLTPVGLLPIAVAGIDIEAMVSGAREALDFCRGTASEGNPSARYAAVRNILFRRGKNLEVLATFQPQLHFVAEWWKQLAGESEGKDGTGIFPASVDYTTDLHSLGQWMQEGVRNVFETFIRLKNTRSKVSVPFFDDNLDGLNYLSEKSFEQINENAYQGTLLAHMDGDVPVSTITVENRSPESIGQLFYFFEKAVALSGYVLRVNPFNQPGVEEYKRNMFALLQKPGFEEQGKSLKNKLKGLGL